MRLIFVITLTLPVLLEIMSEDLRIVGPAAPLVVNAGEDLVLPCSLQPNISAVDMTVEWLRPDLTQANRIVHLYEDQQDRNENQIQSYRGRTGLFKEELQKGNTSLKLSAVQPSDTGLYKCLIQSESWYDDITLQVKVEGHLKLVGPAAPLVAVSGEDLVLPCSIQPRVSAEHMTVEWSRLYLRQTLVHLYEDYEDRNEDQVQSYRGRTGLFKEELQKGNTSLKLSAVQPSDEGVYKCLIQSSDWHDIITVYVEVKGNGFHGLKIAAICISVFLVMFIALAVYIWEVTFSKKQLSPAQCSAVAFIRLQSENVRNEWNLNKYKTSEEGYRRLIPAVTNCRKAQLVGCDLTQESCNHLTLALQTKNSSLKQLELDSNNLQNSGVEQLSAGLKSENCKLEIIRLSDCNLTGKSCKSLTSALERENSSLEQLYLDNNNLQDSGVEQLSAGLNSSHCKLEILSLVDCNLTGESCKYLTSALKTVNSSFKELNLNGNNLQDSGVEQLSAGLNSSHCKLEILRLVGCDLTEESCNHLTSALQNENSLKELDLNNNNLQDSGVEQLSAGLKSSHCKLEILRLVDCNLTQESCKHLTSALQNESSYLKELDLNNNNLQDSGVEQLSAGLKSLHCKLEILGLAMCNLGRRTCENLASALQEENSILRELDLSNNDLNSGVEQLSAGLKSSKCKLEILRLSGCLVTEEGCSSLALALSSNPSHLKELDLTYNHPGESGVKMLSARLKDPHCSLEIIRVEHEGKSRIKPGLKKYACALTLDPNTAHPRVYLSEKNRKVTFLWERQSYPHHPERFDNYKQEHERFDGAEGFDGWLQVLCRESVCGRCYWEVEWSGDVGIAVTYKGISRKGVIDDCVFGMNVKSWSLFCSNNSYSFKHNKKETVLPAPLSTSNRVGVYVDWSTGTLSFYSVSHTHTLTHLHTFHSTFTEPLYAGFGVCKDRSSVCVCEIV